MVASFKVLKAEGLAKFWVAPSSTWSFFILLYFILF